MFVNGEDASAELNGFTLTNGSGSLDAPPEGVPGRTHGGGIWCYNNASPTLVNLNITGNEGQQGGGTLHCAVRYTISIFFLDTSLIDGISAHTILVFLSIVLL